MRKCLIEKVQSRSNSFGFSIAESDPLTIAFSMSGKIYQQDRVACHVEEFRSFKHLAAITTHTMQEQNCSESRLAWGKPP